MLPPRLWTWIDRVGVGREVVGEAQRHHHRGQARLHVERAVAAARVVRVAGDLGERVARPRAVVDEEHRAVAVRDFQQRTHRFGVLAREEGVARHLRADHARQPERPLELGGGGGHVRQGQRGVSGEAAGMLLANRGKPVVDAPAQRPGHFQRLGLDPAERAEQRQHAHLDPLAVHPTEMEIDVIEGLGERLFAHPRTSAPRRRPDCARCAVPWSGRAGRRLLRRASNGHACRSSWLFPPRVVRQLNPTAARRKLHRF